MDHASILSAPDFLSLALGVSVYLLGVALTRRFAFLRAATIPEPVTGGLLAALAVWAFHLATGLSVEFDMQTRDRLLVLFFAAVGVNARLADLWAGGRTLAILCALTAIYVFLQNGVGAAGAAAFGLPQAAGPMLGSVALVGGHGTTVAWAPIVARDFGFAGAAETGIAMATLGLVVASLIGGPLAGFIIRRRGLQGEGALAAAAAPHGMAEESDTAPIDKLGFMRAFLVIDVAVVLGVLVHGPIVAAGVKLPLFVPCMIMGIVLSNTLPYLFPRMPWPARSPSVALISGFCLSTFLAMSLMSMQLWTLAEVAGPLLGVMAAQTTLAVAFTLFVLFPLLGRDYQAAVLSAGFTGLALGATPTAVASMTAVVKRFGPAPNAFVLLPLVSAFFVDLVNVVAIQFFLNR